MKPLFQELPFPIDSHIHFYVEDLPHFIVPWHYHPAIEIMYITSGTGTRFVGDHVEGYFEGDVCMIGPQLPHEWRNDPVYFDKSSGLRATCICLFFKRQIFEPNLIRLPEMNNIRELIERSRRGIKFVGKSRKKIAELISQSANETGASRVIKSDDFERFNKVYKYLVKNFTSPVKLEEVAALVGLTPTAFCRYFKKRTKKTFVEYLNDMRIGHAKKLLIEGNLKISTISSEAGFNNLSNFIGQFKKTTNMLPSEYQKKYKERLDGE